MNSNSAPEHDHDGGAALVVCTCPQHGKYEAYRAPDMPDISPIDCPRCIDERQAQQDKQRRSQVDRQLRARALQKVIDAAAIPARFAARSLDDFVARIPQQRLALALCRAYVGAWPDQLAKGGSLVFTGRPGTGKTHLACAIANRVMPEYLATVAFGSVSTVMRGIRATYAKGSDRTEAQALADLMKPDLLILDEIGAQSGSDHEMQMLFDIINRRYENLRPMILVSNLNADDLQKFLGQRAMDRFRECGTVLAFDWESHRGSVQGAA